MKTANKTDILMQKAEKWTNDLLDLSKRNRLIHFTETKGSTLCITTPDFYDLYERLVENDGKLRFAYEITRSDDAGMYNVLRLFDGLGYHIEAVKGDIRTNKSINDQTKILRGLRNKAKLAFDEQGINLLYLVFGFLKWYDGTKDEMRNSPLLLVPVKLEQAVNGQYELSLYEDDIVINPTLKFALEDRMGYSIPEFNAETDSLREYLSKLVVDFRRKGIALEEKCYIGNLSFMKINMYQDLKLNGNRIVNNPVLQQIYTEQPMSGEVSYDHDSVSEIDRIEVMSADSSQQDAIAASRENKSFVLQGPPGTGKSQTITNIIAQALYDKKRVLFVSEKMAALQVVYSRLREVGLGDFCLPLHDYKADKKKILAQIAKTLTLNQEEDSVKVKQVDVQLERLRDEQNQYAKAIHMVRSAYDMSLYDAIGRVLSLPGEGISGISFRNVKKTERLDLSAQKELIDELALTEKSLSVPVSENAWRGYKKEGLSRDKKNAAIASVKDFLTYADKHSSCVEAYNQLTGCDIAGDSITLKRKAQIVRDAKDLKNVPDTWHEYSFKKLKEFCNEEISLQKAINDQKESLKAYFKELPVEIDASEWCARFAGTDAIVKISNYSDIEDKIAKVCELNKKLAEVFDTYSNKLPVFLSDSSVLMYAKLHLLWQEVKRNSGFSFALLRKGKVKFAEPILQKSKSVYSAIQKKKDELVLLLGNPEEMDLSMLEQSATEWKNRDCVRIPRPIYRILERLADNHDINPMPDFSLPALKKRMDILIDNLYPKSKSKPAEPDYVVNAAKKLLDYVGNVEEFYTLFDELAGPKSMARMYRIKSAYSSASDFADEIPHAWCTEDGRKKAAEALDAIAKLQDEGEKTKSLLLSTYSEELLNIDLEAMSGRFEGEYNKLFGHHKSGYKQDFAAIKACFRDKSGKITDEDIKLAINKGLAAQKAIRSVSAAYDQSRDFLYRNRETKNVSVIRSRLEMVSFLSTMLGEDLSMLLTDVGAEKIRKSQTLVCSLTEEDVRKYIDIVLPNSACDDVFAMEIREVEANVRQQLDRAETLQKEYENLKGGLVSGSTFGRCCEYLTTCAKKQEEAVENALSMLHDYVSLKAEYGKETDKRAELFGNDWNEDCPDFVSIERTIEAYRRMNRPDICEAIAEMAELQSKEYLCDCAAKLTAWDVDALLADAQELVGVSVGTFTADKLLEKLKTVYDALTEKKRLIDEVRPYLAQQNNMSDLLKVMRRYETYSRQHMQRMSHRDEAQRMFGTCYTGDETDWPAVLRLLYRWSDFEGKYPELCGNDKSGKRPIDTYCSSEMQDWAMQTLLVLQDEEEALEKVCVNFEPGVLNGNYEQTVNLLRAAAEKPEELDEYVLYSYTYDKIKQEGLCKNYEALKNSSCMPEEYADAYERAFLSEWIDEYVNELPDMVLFNGLRQEEKIAKLKELCDKQLEGNRIFLRNTMIDRIPHNAGGEMAVLRKELNKKSRQMPLRKLFRSIPNLLPHLKPCLMMSPLSVAYFLNADEFHFDLVIFDEASQINPEDAIGAILRGSQVIIAGDTRQMPPTNFFNVNNDTEEADDEDTVYTPLGDSILEESEYSLRQIPLRWHYRSKNEELIAFSNENIYEGKLFTFPDNEQNMPDSGVEYEFVSDGVYSNKKNEREAERCVRLIEEHVRKHPDRSLGVIALSESQQNMIEDKLNAYMQKHSMNKEFFDENKEEPFFIKNLENVQGDERDTIIISICYGKSADGKMRMNFGPIGHEGGERRLNVAITRAKQNVKLVGSIHASDIDLNRAKSEGARMLREYIEFAENGDMSGLNQAKAGHDDFADDVEEFLGRNGYRTKRNIGRSSYTIDIAVFSKLHPECLMMAVQCDGFNYGTARTAKDRDVVRLGMLRRLGWNLYNCWSMDWYSNPVKAQKALLSALEKAETMPVNTDKPARKPGADVKSWMNDEEDLVAVLNIQERLPELEKYRSGDKIRMNASVFDSRYSARVKRMLHFISCEQPIGFNLLCKRMMPTMSALQVNQALREDIEKMIREAHKDIREEDGFYSMKNAERVKPRTAEDREIDDISITELEEDILAGADFFIGSDESEIIRKTTRMIGFQRTGARITERLQLALKRLQDEGRVEIRDGKVIFGGTGNE